MTVDDKDLTAFRPDFDGLVPLADKLDLELGELRTRLEPLLTKGRAEASRGEYAAAALTYDEIARVFRAAHFSGEADTWARRSIDCILAARLRHRTEQRKGKGWRR